MNAFLLGIVLGFALMMFSFLTTDLYICEKSIAFSLWDCSRIIKEYGARPNREWKVAVGDENRQGLGEQILVITEYGSLKNRIWTFKRF